MYKSVVAVYDGEKLLGDVDVYFNHDLMNQNVKLKDKIRISYYSTPSDRCSPLAVLYTISSSPSGVCLKMECKNTINSNSQLNLLHSTCLGENKTAVVSLGGDELHLVAMRSRRNDSFPCFWGFIVAPGLYESCLVMLNLRCLGIVFDLDETLIVANTSRSFEDRIEALERKLSCEIDPQRIAAMVSEIKRYQDDRNILKQYAESDQVVENGKIIHAESEVVPGLSDKHQAFLRPIIRLLDKNVILTRINPLIRDTSVLVRLRPAWEDLRSYLIARGRKRFEVYVCTMAERDYALEMWRLLDPDSNLITVKELYNRIVCVKSGQKKSLFNVFQDGNCHPKMALVIDDRLKVWDERDQPRVHVVPAFAPYYAPQAEVNNAIPILCVARNIACNVRGGFFKDFDDGLLQRFNEVTYEDDIKNISPPDVSNYLISEDDTSALNGIKEPISFDGMADVEVGRRLKEAIASSTIAPVMPKPASMSIMPSGPMVQYPNKQLPHVIQPLTHVNRQETSLHSSPAREEGEVPESELDPDTRRRLLILQHGMDTRDQVSGEPAQFPVRQPSAPRVEPCGRWFPLGEDMGPRELNRIAPPLKEFSLHTEPMQIDKKHPVRAPPFVYQVEGSILPDRVPETHRLIEILQRDDRLRLSHSPSVHPSFSGEESSLDIETGGSDTFSEYLRYIAFKCGTKIEFKETLVPSIKLQFSFEVWFAGEKIGDGTGHTRREAQHHAAESSLMNLADKYLSLMGESTSFSTAKLETPKNGSIAALHELCMMEGLGMTFLPQPQFSNNMGLNNELYAQVEIDGEVWGKGVGLTWDEAKMQAAEAAYQNLKAKIAQYPQKRQLLSRSFQGMSTKRFRPEYPGFMQRMPSSARYPSLVP